ncbi:MAG TPA: ABC transporter ATP-binding protein [Gaiellaceae bacterium]|jgi:putative ABC transport system ATP-binding protein|nr:ABC transporter ATP-binding protein [Gaiellaceae bacterium]
MSLYRLNNVTKSFRQGGLEILAVCELDLTISTGEFVAVAGPSGSGKTTLLQLLGALDRPTRGELLFEGRDLARESKSSLTRLRRETIGFVFQQFNLIPTLTAAENVEAALAPTGRRASERRSAVAGVLDAVGLADRAGHLPSELSGGEQQRVAIARALVNEPRVVLADEPTGNLDSATGQEIVSLLRALSSRRGETIVLITHDPDVAARADRVVRLADGRLLDAA